MRKFFCLTLVIALLCCMCACKGEQTNPGQTPNTQNKGSDSSMPITDHINSDGTSDNAAGNPSEEAEEANEMRP